jgi:hypothetical protein
MSASLNDRLASVPVRNAKAALRESETDLRKLKGDEKALNKDAGEILAIAMDHARMEAKQVADIMGISHSLVLRGLKGLDSLSFHKLYDLPDAFWEGVLIAIATKRRIAQVRTTIEVGRRIA